MNTLQIVRTALSQRSLSGIIEILGAIATELRATGAIIWEANPDACLRPGEARGSLFVLAQWFRIPRQQAPSDLDISTPIGTAVVETRKLNVTEVFSDPALYGGMYPFSVDPTLKSYCALPFQFLDGARAALAVYRNSGFFSGPELNHIEVAAELLPNLYQATRNQISLNLIGDVTRIVQTAEQKASIEALSFDEMRNSIQEICNHVGDTFACMETTIYVENSIGEPGVYRLAGSTLEAGILKSFYHPAPQEGITGWVLSHGKPIRIFDLLTMKARKVTDPRMSDVTWHDPMDLARLARTRLNLRQEDPTPPLSYMAAPILIGDRVLGAIRCCVSKRGPYYFADRELTLLKIVAAHVGQFWNNWLTRHRIDRENKLWRKVVEQVSDANQHVKAALEREVPERAPIVEEAAWEALGDLQEQIDNSEHVATGNVVVGFRNPTGEEAAATATKSSPAATMRDMLVRQIQLYKDLAETVQARYKAQRELRASARQQNQTYLDLAHQLKTPILSAYRRANLAVRRTQSDEELRASLKKMRGLCAKARTVTMSVKLFADLANHQKLTASLVRVRPEDLRKLAIECADDTQTVIDSSRNLQFSVERKGFDVLADSVVMGDTDLLLQAISNVLDNAGKYSRNDTTIKITAGSVKSGFFHISVFNKPFFRPKDPDKWIIRGWRSDEAQSVTAEGSGIGLWIVDSIMKAQEGNLLINPYNQDEMTEVRILLPIKG